MLVYKLDMGQAEQERGRHARQIFWAGDQSKIDKKRDCACLVFQEFDTGDYRDNGGYEVFLYWEYMHLQD